MVGAKSLVTKNCTANTRVWGIPARSLDKTRKQLATMARLPGLVRRLNEQGRELQELKRRLAELENK